MEEIEEARAGIYWHFSGLYLNELNETELADMKEAVIDGLRSHGIPVAEDEENSTASRMLGFLIPETHQQESWLQAQRVEYARLFLMNVYPYESIYTGAEVMLNTGETEQVNFYYQDFGFSSKQKVFPDHIGVELEFMRMLAEHEADARQKNRTAQAAYLARASHDFLQQHLLAWLPAFTLALGRITTSDFYRSLAEETLAFVCLDFRYLSQNLNLAGKRSDIKSIFSIAEVETERETAANEQGLRSLINHLITPIKAGFYLSRLEILRLAQSMQLPPGGDDRFQMLKNLFEVAAQYGTLHGLIEKLLELVQSYQVEFARLQAEFAEAGLIWQVWQQRLENSHKMLEEMKEALVEIN